MITLRSVVLGATLLIAPAFTSQLLAQETPEPQGPDTVLYQPPRGDVTFTHAKHAKLTECVSCHHESKPEQPRKATNAKEKCSSCHTTPAAEPMKTTLRRAYHDTANKAGICYDCHNKEVAAGKPVPVACNDCHKKVE